MKQLWKKRLRQLLDCLFVGLMAYGLNVSPLEASVVLGIVGERRAK